MVLITPQLMSREAGPRWPWLSGGHGRVWSGSDGSGTSDLGSEQRFGIVQRPLMGKGKLIEGRWHSEQEL